MDMHRSWACRRAPAIVAAAVVAGCSGQDAVVGPETVAGPPSGVALAAAGAAAVAGAWEWSRVEHIRMPLWFVEQVLNAFPGNDVDPEGPNTLASCHTVGTMTLIQDGSAFAGVAQPTSVSCTTQGGQSFTQPGAGAPLAVFDGEIRGNSVSFSLGNPVVTPCPYHAAVRDSDGGSATALSGAGRCVLPGHPQSGSIMQSPPPPGGTSVSVSFDAWR